MEGEKILGVSTFLSFTILFVAYTFNSGYHEQKQLQSRLSQILESMLQIEQDYSVKNIKIAVGYGACNDLFVNASEIFFKKAPPLLPVHHGYIDSERELEEVYALFFNAGSAAERFVSDSKLFDELVKKAVDAPHSYYVLGGNAPVMAKRFALEGASLMLAARQENYLMENVPNKNFIVSGGSSSNLKQDIHLILEYSKGEKWGDYSSPRANRFIIHNDASNPKLESAVEFGLKLSKFNPNLLVVGGLQMMDNFPYKKGEKEKYLSIVRDQINSLPKTSLVHFELASFTDEDLLQHLKKIILPNVDSIGMNEQELPNLHNLMKYNNISVVASQDPRVVDVLLKMRDLFRILGPSPKSNKARPLTRIHVHTLAFQIIMVDLRGAWKNTRAAATKAALVAHRHVCSKNKVDVRNSDILMDEGFSLSKHPNTGRVMFDDLNPVSCWIENTHYQICIAPVLICTKVRQTAGGGDNISAAGLVLQV